MPENFFNQMSPINTIFYVARAFLKFKFRTIWIVVNAVDVRCYLLRMRPYRSMFEMWLLCAVFASCIVFEILFACKHIAQSDRVNSRRTMAAAAAKTNPTATTATACTRESIQFKYMPNQSNPPKHRCTIQVLYGYTSMSRAGAEHSETNSF